MKSMKNLGRAVSGVAASVKKAAPMMAGAAAKAAQPMSTQTRARMPNQAPLGNLRSAVKSAATSVKTAIEKQPALQKSGIGAALQKKPIGRMVGGLAGKFIKRR